MRFGLVVEYDGTEFHGSQLQANARTVQGEIEDALRKIFNENIRMYLASRTDSGVHARGQVGRFDEETNLTLDKIRIALNHYMAKDVRIRCVQFVQDGPNGFDPRGDASSRTYVYTFNDARSEPALDRHFVTHVRKSLDAVMMNEASQSFVGLHDFAAFAGPSTPPDAPTLRNVASASATRNGDNVEFKITANAYLHQQIRRIAGVLYEVGSGKTSPEIVGQLLASANRGEASHVMPAEGLCLEEITYNGSGECGLPSITTADSTDLRVD
ncbi:MAG: tRNA pseudouridine(38-40) synthase TruA [Dehalococcoidia bacterium]|mgnify:FL=1|jgi:tRNA pseudouridine38-40 synthase|nr:tRNA pseudouridine(38-40) synthase TruA [Chloroflexota bacterium]MDP6056310.1 tRNA pseudouridine(38-40) synthase TruA [Dehalococcoidia bacterium]MDP7261011.1 tRNA pseudouridine(38-40) synthase TruA [Dehalococcoidia bacterium]|tara:strand:- start:590 stop:1399 length:810 start_codon:yes stop_codon:yes gene_type:complete